jgi:Lar family restriction alleviation protein
MTKNKDPLKPCPFCGSALSERVAVIASGEGEEDDRGLYWRCCGCGARTGRQETVERARNAWQARIRKGSEG